EENGLKRCACPDRDRDGFTDYRCGGLDCNDYDKNINPAAIEDCSTGDLNCDGRPVECKSDQKCIDGYCANPCMSGECQKGYECINGYCIPQNPCIEVSCPEGTFCENGKCVDYCKNVICPDETYCYMGKCYGYNDSVIGDGQINDIISIDEVVLSDSNTFDSSILKDKGINDSSESSDESADSSGCSCSIID
ncbi:MAG: hypothetical protein ACPL7I_11160, partial [Myxococcota bacterium]